jgi:hypothetical protein
MPSFLAGVQPHPPLSHNSMWFYAKESERLGPVARDTIKQLFEAGQITADTLVWQEGMEDWKPLRQTELVGYMAPDVAAAAGWKTCAYSGDKVPEDQMVEIAGFQIAERWKDEAVQYVQQGGELPRYGASPSSGKLANGNLELGSVLSRAWGLFTGTMPALLIFTLLIMLPMNLITTYLQQMAANGVASAGRPPEISNFAPLLAMWPVLIIFSVIHSSGVNVLYRRWDQGQSISVGVALKEGMSYWWYTFTATLVMALLAIAGVMALCVGLLFVMAAFWFIGAVAVDQKAGGFRAAQICWTLVKPHFWLSMGYCLLIAIMVGIPSGLYGAAVNFIPELRIWWVGGITASIVGLPSIFMSAFAYSFYRTLQSRVQLSA